MNRNQKKLTRLLTVTLLVIVLVLSMFAGCNQKTDTAELTALSTEQKEEKSTPEPEPEEVIKIRYAVTQDYSPSLPENTELLDYINKRVLEVSNVECEIYRMNPELDGIQWWQMVAAADDMPELAGMWGTRREANQFKFVVDNDVVWELSPELQKENMVNYFSQLEYYGIDADAVLRSTQYAEDGKNYYIGDAVNALTATKNMPMIKKINGVPWSWYTVWCRDDILKKVYPNAKTEAELLKKYQTEGSLTLEDITDNVVWNSLDELYDYLNKVKEMKLVEIGKPVIPAALNSSSESVASVQWSLQTITGWSWKWPLMFEKDLKDSFFLRTSDYMKDYVKWFNKLYTEELLDPEIFIMKNDQYKAKALNGEYAVVNDWLGIENIRENTKDRGYGWVPVPLGFHYLDMDTNNNGINLVQPATYSLWVTKAAKEEDLDNILKWVDFYYSEESEALSYWGLPDWYEGDGADRRYKPEFKAIEDYALYGIASENDGATYGLAYKSGAQGPNAERSGNIRPPINFIKGGGYPMEPGLVYEKDTSKETSLRNEYYRLMKVYTVEEQDTYLAIGADDSYWSSTPEWTEFDKEMDWSAAGLKWIDAIVSPADEFDDTWAEFIAIWDQYGIDAAEQAVADKIAEAFEKTVISENKIKVD